MHNIQRRQLLAELPIFSADIDPLLQRIYTLRGITGSDDLSKTTHHLLDYKHLTGIDLATDILYLAIKANQRIVIIGDFDTDGATSTALMVTALRKMGAQSVDYIIPDRFEDGYGLSIAVVDKAIARGVDLIITVDNGISSFTAVEYAKQQGLNVIITDHHLAPTQLPPADAIINPNLPDCPFVSKHLAGVGVSFYFMLALRAMLRDKNWFINNNIKEYNLANLLDLVALGTVADVVNLDHNNRILVHQGISRIRAGYCCLGINTLIAIAKKKNNSITSSDLGFYLAPRLNAAGRMENMYLGVELLLCEDDNEAMRIAQQLDSLNIERKAIEQSMHAEALVFIQQLEENTSSIPNSLVVYHPEWHQGIIGILSSRLKEKFYRPVISFATAEDGYLKGSGRSINGVHLRDILETIDHQYPGVIICFGGHAMAAGLTIRATDLDQFSQYFAQAVSAVLTDDLLHNVIETDGALENEFFNYQTAKILKEVEPWGAGFCEPIFDGEFIVHQQKMIADKHLKIVVEPISGGPLLECIAFNVNVHVWPDQSIKRVKLVYHLDVDEFRGNQNVKLLIRHLWPLI